VNEMLIYCMLFSETIDKRIQRYKRREQSWWFYKSRQRG
jgi:hypothetical protein